MCHMYIFAYKNFDYFIKQSNFVKHMLPKTLKMSNSYMFPQKRSQNDDGDAVDQLRVFRPI